ncbi:S-layer homology domain-containing protein [Deinococcus sp.]|uniref:S-layer homology domain-containing protein n=1 Tax=Deinococcus sp. TaxID=47478 RepID=UPI003B5A88FB
MNKFLTIAATLALALGVASAQDTTTDTTTDTAAPATTVQVTNFTDVPAGHWAKDAVDLITQRGLIQGFPDGTFRGNENLTRYQAALIFARLLQTGAMTDASSGLSAEDMATITKGMQDVSTELAAVSSRVTDLETASTAQQDRITALEGQIAALGTGGTDTALTARVDALEQAVQNLPAGPAGEAGPAGPEGPAGPAADVTALEARVAALEAAGTSSTSTETTVTTPAPTDNTTVVIGDTSGDTMMAEEGNSGLYAGITTGFVFNGQKGVFGNSGTNDDGTAKSTLPFVSNFGATIGASKVLYGAGLRANVEYVPASEAIQGDVNVMYGLGLGRFTPYVGVGGGLSSSKERANTANRANDFYINGIVGVESKIYGNFGAFAEGSLKYYLTNKGVGTNVAADNASLTDTTYKSFSPAAKIGLKYYF